VNTKAKAYSQPLDGTALVEKHASLVKRIAHHLMVRLPASVLVDDLIQAGHDWFVGSCQKFRR